MKPPCKIGPSILQADLSSLGRECVELMDAGADYMHLDLMDGQFVPNITFGPPVVKNLRPKLPDVFFDLHMMVANPLQWIESSADAAGATAKTQYTFHVEATDKPAVVIRKVKECGMRCGLGIKPGTPVSALFPYLEMIDTALIMTVEPGFGGQKFMADMMDKVRLLRQKCASLDIEVDGGVGPGETVQLCADSGANLIVSGSAITSSADPAAVMRDLRLPFQ